MDQAKMRSGGAVLFDPREEKFAQLVAKGVTPPEAKRQLNLPRNWSAKRLLSKPHIAYRIANLQEQAARQVVVSRSDILYGVLEEWHLARLAGQHTAALKAAEMYGSEAHGMFRKQVEIGRVGEFDHMSEDELKAYIHNKMVELGLDPTQQTKLIEKPKNQDTDSK